MNEKAILASRETGTLPLSIGTSNAIESLRDGSKKPQNLFVNVHTLMRNIWASLPSAEAPRISKLGYAQVLGEEMMTIMSTLKEFLPNTVTTFYIPSYKDFNTFLPGARCRTANTDKQKVYAALSGEVLLFVGSKKELLKEKYGIELTFGTHGPTKVPMGTMIFTHHPVDLLSCPSDAILLESMTGAMKGRPEWHTKLYNGKEYVRLPFCKLTLTVFGDNTDFSPHASKVKNVVIALAEEHKWDPNTTNDRIRFCLGRMKDQYSADLLKAWV